VEPDTPTNPDERPLNPYWTVVAAFALFAAGTGAFFSLLAFSLVCDENCTDGRSWEDYAQFGLAILGLGLCICLLLTAIQEARRATIALFISALVVFAAWGVIFDYAVHG
jgi:hypothetical protein